MVKSVMMKSVYFLIITLLSCNLNGQSPVKDAMYLSTMIRKMSKDSIRANLTVLAADDMEGREVGFPGNVKAAKFIAGKLASYGFLSPPRTYQHLQYFPLYKQQFKNIGIEVAQDSYQYLEDFYALPSQNPNLPSFEANEILYAGYGVTEGALNDFSGADFTNKVVMIEEGEPGQSGGSLSWREMTDRFNKKLEVAKNTGVRVLLVVSDQFDSRLGRFRSILSSPSLSLELNQASGVNVIYISSSLAARIMKGNEDKIDRYRQDKYGGNGAHLVPVVIRKPIRINMHKLTEYEYVPNAVGYLPGKDPLLRNELLVITAHLDHLGMHDGQIWNGADDDGSGVATVLEIARVMGEVWKQDDSYPRRSLLILLVNGEEKGLFGSSYYTDHPLYPLESTIANLNIDMIGRRDEAHKDNPYYVYIIGSNMLSNDLHEINENVNRELTHLELDYRYNSLSDPNRFYFRSDHYNFAKNNIPVIFYFTGVHEDYHQPTDTIEKIEFGKMLTIGQLVMGTAWELLNGDKRPALNQN